MKLRTMMQAALAFVATCAFADDPVYITGATYEVSNTTWLVVKSGDGVLVAPFDKMDGNNFSRLVVERGASLKIGVDSPFSSSRPVLYINGTLDINGHSFRALRLFNDPNMNIPADADDLRSVPGRIINSSETAATLSFESQSSSYFYGSIEECPGAIDITSVGNGDFVVKSPVITKAISSIAATGSKGSLRPETMPTMFKFVFQPPSDPAELMKLGEIELTYRGKTVRGATVTTVTTSSKSDDASSRNTNLIDGKANSYWTAGTTGGQTVTISINPPGPVDGYRISPHRASNRPTGWDVYVSRGTDGWKSFLVDSKRDFQWYSRRDATSSTNILFSSDVRLGNVFGPNTAVTLSSSAATPMEVSTITPMEIKSLSGSGQVLLRHDTVFGPGDVSGFTGEFCHAGNPTWLKMGYLTLSSRNGAEQQLSVSDGSNLSVVNGDEDPVSVLLDDTSAFADRHLFGRLADGEKGALGLVKRGSGERVIETGDAAYTGPTAIHGGTLTVAKRRASYTAQYIRITPTLTHGSNTSNPWGMTEFELLDENGNKVDWPSGTEVSKPENTDALASTIGLPRLIDGNIATRMLMSKYTSGSGYPPATIDTKTGVTFSSYRWYTPHNRKEDPDRTPVRWIIEISNSGQDGSWVVCDEGSQEWSAEDEADNEARTGDAFTDFTGRLRGPFTATGQTKSAGTSLYTLDSAFFGEGSSVAARDTHRKLKSRYFMFKVLETANPDRDQYSYGWELAEISLYRDGERVSWPDGTTIVSAGGSVNGNSNSRLTNLVNNVVWEPDGRATTENPNAERTFVMEMPSFVVIDAGEELEFDAYAFVSTSSALVNTDRIPKAWTFGIATSNDSNDNFVTIDSAGNYTPGVDYVITQAYQRLGPFDVASKFPYLDTSAANSIGDRSPVAIDEGATLKIDADYEQFGPLSGAGSLDLVLNAVGEINACAPATFSGNVTGEGTLAVCGADVQTFAGASLSGVKTLELNGGEIAGTASFGGSDVTVAFNGGATGAALSGIGTLTVTGDVKYALPDLAGQNAYSVTLFTATSIPSASQDLLRAGVVDVPHGWLCTVTVTDTTVTLDARKRGLVLIIQ